MSSATLSTETMAQGGNAALTDDPKVARQTSLEDQANEQIDQDTRHMIDALDRKRRRLDEEIARFKAAKDEEYRQYEIQLRRLFGKDPDHQQDLRRHSDDAGSRQSPEEPASEEIELAPEPTTDAGARPHVGNLDGTDSFEEELLGSEDANGGGSSHVEHIRSPHEREREFRGVFTPSYLPLLETKKDNHVSTGNSGATSSSQSITTEDKQKEEVEQTATISKEPDSTGTQQPESPPSPLSASEKAVSSPRPILFRRSSLKDPSKKNTSPKRVFFILEDRLVAPSASLEESSPFTPPSYESISYEDSPSDYEASLLASESPSSPMDMDPHVENFSAEAAHQYMPSNPEASADHRAGMGAQFASKSPNSSPNVKPSAGHTSPIKTGETGTDLGISGLSLDQTPSHQDDDHDDLFELDEEIDPALSYAPSSRNKNSKPQDVFSHIENRRIHEPTSSSYSFSGFGGYNMPGASAPTGVNPLNINPNSRQTPMGSRKSSLPISYDYLLGMTGSQGHSAPAYPVGGFAQGNFRHRSAKPYSGHGALGDQNTSHSRYSMGGRLATFKEEEENKYNESHLNSYGTPNSTSGSLRIPSPKPFKIPPEEASSPPKFTDDQTPRGFNARFTSKDHAAWAPGNNDILANRKQSDYQRGPLSSGLCLYPITTPLFCANHSFKGQMSHQGGSSFSSSQFRNPPVGSFQERFNREEQDRQRALAERRTHEDHEDHLFDDMDDVGGVEEIEDMEGL
ncbi:hypothetical protein L228DRAFT_156926 [Xylona heveae TC161]|uniref:Uncharacterized protein n=1 Tax=Xylona heveae (strain CBS 132557 / TC161) TaxID=1328760 RepID=A0A165G234_XYLHT|nr:hypothetical protein L228DRAFT_156926 [Xylona heveae TC161]KZF21650.1 hypothetical protein L228DRAFT_156926 [Xylona heveae TC161]